MPRQPRDASWCGPPRERLTLRRGGDQSRLARESTATGRCGPSGVGGGDPAMTDFTYFPSDAVGEDSLAEDAPTVQWVDQQLDEAEARGGLGGLALHVQAYSRFQADELAGLFSEAESSSEEQESEEALHPPRAREEIRELIFSRLRRPDGAPYAAGYTTGPAARKAMYEGEDTRVGWRGPNNPAAAAQDGLVTHYEDRATLDQRAAEALGGPVIGTHR